MQIKTYSPLDTKVKALIYWASWTGKTSFWGTAHKVLFASAEAGMLSIADKQVSFVEVKSLSDLKSLLAYLMSNDHGFETVVIDSISEINEIIKTDIEKRTGKNMQLQDRWTLAKEIKSILRWFRDLPMHVLFIAQESNEKDEDRIEKIVPSLNGKAATEIAYFMDIVWYIYIDKAWERKIITGANSKLLTKDRSNKIWNDCPLDMSVWIERVKWIKVWKQEVLKDIPDESEEVKVGKTLTKEQIESADFYNRARWKSSSIIKEKYALTKQQEEFVDSVEFGTWMHLNTSLPPIK